MSGDREMLLQINRAIGTMGSDISNVKVVVREIKADLSSKYVRKEEFDPIKKWVNLQMGLMGVAIISALLALIIKQ